jgi:tetratricopeptide (TPR) repeat protein
VGPIALSALLLATTAPVLAEPASSASLSPMGRLDARAGLPGRWDRELSRREAILKAHRGKDPAAVLALVGLLSELEGEIDPARLEKFVDDVLRDGRRHPLVRSHAALTRARLHEARGELQAARKLLVAHGHVLDWQIVGPFDNSGHAGETRSDPPMTEPFDASQTFSGKLPGEPLAWRAYEYEGIPSGGYVSLDDVLRPNEQVTGYATAWVKAAERTDAVVHLGTGGPYQLFVGPAKVGEGEAERAPNVLQDAHAVTLQPGWNRVLVKVSAMAGMWGFQLRLSRRDGRPIEGLVASAEAPSDPAAKAAPDGRAAEVAAHSGPKSLREALERAYPAATDPAGKRPGSVSAGLDLVEFYRWVGPFDRDDETLVELARAVDARAKSSRSAYLSSLVDRDTNTSRTALVQGIERARKEGASSRWLLGRMLLELAWRDRSLGLERRYRVRLDEAIEASPDDAVIELALADRMAEDGFGWVALSWVEDMARRYPHSSTIHTELASRLGGQGHTKKALDVLEAMEARAGHGSAHTGLRIAALLDLGQADAAAELARRSTAATPGLPEAWARVAHLEEARGADDEAQAALAKAISLAPQDADLYAVLGRLQARAGAKDVAIANLRRSLELMPQQPEVRDLLATLDAKGERDLMARYGVDFAKIAAAPTPKSWKGKDAGLLHHGVAVRVLPNGLTERLDHRIIRVLDDRGVRSQSVQGIVYDPAESTVDVRRSRVRRADGTIEELGERHVVPLASAGYRMFYDQRQLLVEFPGLRVGDTIEVAFVQRDVAARNMFDEYFGDLVPLQGMQPRAHVEYVLEAPSDKPIYFNVPISKKTDKRTRTTTYRFVADDVVAIKPEPAMPGWTEISKYLHASTYKSWDDVGRWYWDLVREQLVVDDDIRAGVTEALAKLPAGAGEREKVYAIYEHVVRNTRYVGLEFGIHGYKPYRTTEIYSRRFGDCKDKASLLKVMLAEAGIDSHLVLVRTRDQGTLPTEPASLAAFNHAITYVPSLDLYLDGTAEWSGPEELPESDQGASVLVVTDGKGGEYRSIPVSEPGKNVRRIDQRVQLSADGSARVEHAVRVSGANAAGIRFQFQSADSRPERMAEALSGIFPGVEVDRVDAPDITDIGKPAELGARLRVPGWARSEGDGRRFHVLGRTFGFGPGLTGQAQRRHEMVLEVPTTEVHHVEYALPGGHRFSRVPADKDIKTPVGRFSLKVQATDDGAKVDTELVLPKYRLSPKEYGELRDFLRRVDESLEQTFEVVPAR